MRLHGCAVSPETSLLRLTLHMDVDEEKDANIARNPAWLPDLKKVLKKVLTQSRYPSYKLACAFSEDSNQTAHSCKLIRVFVFRQKKHWILSYPKNAH